MHTPTFSQSNTDHLYHPCTFPFILALLYAAAGSNFMVSSSDDQATSKDHLHPSLPSHKMLIYSFNLLKFPYPSYCQSTRTATSLSSVTPLSPLTFKSQIILLLNIYYLSRCYLTQQQLVYCHSPHCHPSLLVLILNNLILQINIQIFTLSLMHFIPKEKK